MVLLSDSVSFRDLVSDRCGLSPPGGDDAPREVDDPGAVWDAEMRRRSARQHAPRPPAWAFDTEHGIDAYNMFKDLRAHFNQYGFLDTSSCRAFTDAVLLRNMGLTCHHNHHPHLSAAAAVADNTGDKSSLVLTGSPPPGKNVVA